jgi:hypothetical protein
MFYYSQGGVVKIEITWDCNLDYDIGYCKPEYSFGRFDLSFKSSSVAAGYNFRYADKYEVNGIKYRTLIKAYGLRFVIVVNGQARKFDFIPLFLTIGAGKL